MHSTTLTIPLEETSSGHWIQIIMTNIIRYIIWYVIILKSTMIIITRGKHNYSAVTWLIRPRNLILRPPGSLSINITLMILNDRIIQLDFTPLINILLSNASETARSLNYFARFILKSTIKELNYARITIIIARLLN